MRRLTIRLMSCLYFASSYLRKNAIIRVEKPHKILVTGQAEDVCFLPLSPIARGPSVWPGRSPARGQLIECTAAGDKPAVVVRLAAVPAPLARAPHLAHTRQARPAPRHIPAPSITWSRCLAEKVEEKIEPDSAQHGARVGI